MTLAAHGRIPCINQKNHNMKSQKIKLSRKIFISASTVVQNRMGTNPSTTVSRYLTYILLFYKTLKKIKNKNISLFLKLLKKTSLGSADLLSIKKSDLDLSRGVIILKIKKMKGKSRLIPLSIVAIRLLKKCIKINTSCNLVFGNLTIKTIYKEFKRACQLCGIKPFPLHMIRKMIFYQSSPCCQSSNIQNAILNGKLKKLGKLSKAIYGAAEYIIRNKIKKYSNNYRFLDSLEYQKCCQQDKNFKRYGCITLQHQQSMIHLSHIFKCPMKTLKEMTKEENWPLLIGIDPLVDEYLDLKYRGKSESKSND